MKIKARYVLPAILLLAGCATAGSADYGASNPALAPGAAPPQRVNAASDALAARMNTMLANPTAASSVTR